MQDLGHPFDNLVMGELSPETAWECAKQDALTWSKAFYEAGYHKQCYNRLTEPFSLMKTVISGTEWANFFWLRCDGAADPTIEELARCMQAAQEQSTPNLLQAGEWHLPYVEWKNLEGYPFPVWRNEFGSFDIIAWESLIKISAARSAAVSFRNVDFQSKGRNFVGRSLNLVARLTEMPKNNDEIISKHQQNCNAPQFARSEPAQRRAGSTRL